jgi:hypothetical protein
LAHCSVFWDQLTRQLWNVVMTKADSQLAKAGERAPVLWCAGCHMPLFADSRKALPNKPRDVQPTHCFELAVYFSKK